MISRSWRLVVAVGLLVLLAALATLQYRWVGEISAAERERLQASVRTRASELAAAVDRDISRTFAAFQVDSAAFESDAPGALADAAARAAQWTAAGSAVKAVFVAEPGSDASLRRLDAAARAIVPAAWPPELAVVRARILSAPRAAFPGLPLPPGLYADALEPSAPAFIVPITAPLPALRSEPGQMVVRAIPEEKPWHAVIVWLDPERLRTDLLAPLTTERFGDARTSEFNVSVVSKADHRAIYESNEAVEPGRADVTADLFTLRLDDLVWTRTPVPPSVDGDAAAAGDAAPPARADNRVAVTIFRREVPGGDPGAPHVVRQHSGWTLAVQSRRGSLDAVVARTRTRNLGISLGVLGVLAAGVGLILVTSAREQRRAGQQMQFVASVSHELRTPLAVIRSAAENLADGVVSGSQVAAYGTMIRDEGRRLSEMVERVLEYAGMSTGAQARALQDVDVRDAITRAVAAECAGADARGIAILVHAPATLPAIAGDPDAFQSALRNAIGNAVKYSPDRTTIDIDAAAAADTLRIAVADRGIGIDPDDLPHVFTPFFRGRRAIDSQVRGSGLGLSVVDKVVRGLGGDVRLAPRQGGGTVLTMDLPLPAAPGRSAADRR